MWDASKEIRLRGLLDADEQGTLSEQEGAELAALKQERVRHEDAAIEQSARRMAEENTRVATRLDQVNAENRDLEALISEQEAYLADVRSLVTQMEIRRRQWRERYTQVTGRPFGPAGAGGPA